MAEAVSEQPETPVPNPSPTAMVRDYGPSRPQNFFDRGVGTVPLAVYFYTTVCFANFGDEDTQVQFYHKEAVEPRRMSAARAYKIIEGIRDDLTADANTDKGQIEAYPAAEEPTNYLGDCVPSKALHAFSFIKKLTMPEFLGLKLQHYAFFFVGRLVERNTQGTTYFDVCGISVSRSLPTRALKVAANDRRQNPNGALRGHAALRIAGSSVTFSAPVIGALVASLFCSDGCNRDCDSNQSDDRGRSESREATFALRVEEDHYSPSCWALFG